MRQINKLNRQKRLVEKRKHKKQMLEKYGHVRSLNINHYRKGLNETRMRHVEKDTWHEEIQITVAYTPNHHNQDRINERILK